MASASSAVSPKKLNTTLTEKDRKFRSKEFLVDTPYKSMIHGKDWNDTFKDYVKSLENNQKKLDYLLHVREYIESLAEGQEKSKKKITLNNRLKEVKKEAYYSYHGGQQKIEKVGCVLLDQEGNVLVNRNKRGQYGFPKGDIEYQIGTTLDTVTRENPRRGALRELEEEMAIFKHGELSPDGDAKGVKMEQTFKKKDEKKNETKEAEKEEEKQHPSRALEVVGWREYYFGENYYFVLSVKKTNDFKVENYITEANESEGIVGIEWQPQWRERTRADFNSFSRRNFLYTVGPSPIGGPAMPREEGAGAAGGAGGSGSATASSWRTGTGTGTGGRRKTRRRRA